MSIDRIGKGGGIVPPTPNDVKGPSGAGGGDAPFQVDRAGAAAGVALSPLEKLRTGDLTIGQYLDLKVGEATAHLGGHLAPEQLDFVQKSLREQLATDPVLADLVKSATGMLPPPSE